jgi:hypothetical protein
MQSDCGIVHIIPLYSVIIYTEYICNLCTIYSAVVIKLWDVEWHYNKPQAQKKERTAFCVRSMYKLTLCYYP